MDERTRIKKRGQIQPPPPKEGRLEYWKPNFQGSTEYLEVINGNGSVFLLDKVQI